VDSPLNKHDAARAVALPERKILAWFRAGFALIAVAVVQFNPARVARVPLLSYIALGCFLIYSFAVLYLIVHAKADSKKIGVAATCLDLIWVSLIVFSTGGASTPFFVYYFFPVISAARAMASRADWQPRLRESALRSYTV
jgi:uncharacterized membrane protein YidH (DUF202 family)